MIAASLAKVPVLAGHLPDLENIVFLDLPVLAGCVAVITRNDRYHWTIALLATLLIGTGAFVWCNRIG